MSRRAAPVLPPGMKFDKVNHLYTYNGFPIPGVTSVLAAEGAYDEYEGWDAAIRLWALERGARADDACSLIDAGLDLDPDSIDDAIAPYVASYQQFLLDTDFVPELTQHVVCIAGRCAGTLDVTGSLPGHPRSLIDRKLNAAPKATGLQLAAYNAGLEAQGYPHHERFALVLLRHPSPGTNIPGAGYKLRPYVNPHDEGVFMCAMAWHEWKAANSNGR